MRRNIKGRTWPSHSLSEWPLHSNMRSCQSDLHVHVFLFSILPIFSHCNKLFFLICIFEKWTPLSPVRNGGSLGKALCSILNEIFLKTLHFHQPKHSFASIGSTVGAKRETNACSCMHMCGNSSLRANFTTKEASVPTLIAITFM
jgi:hypothetical protein